MTPPWVWECAGGMGGAGGGAQVGVPSASDRVSEPEKEVGSFNSLFLILKLVCGH